MPIARIFSPRKTVPITPARAAQIGPNWRWYVEELRDREATLDICPPRFKGDVTPPCFVNNPALPGITYTIRVNANGEQAIVLTRQAPDTDSVSATISVQSGETSMMADEGVYHLRDTRKDFLILAQNPLDPFIAESHIGGLLLRFDRPDLVQLAAELFPGTEI